MSQTNHPNRSKKGVGNPCRSPTAEEVKALRAQLGLTQKESATLVCYSERAWQHVEAGERKMHPAAWQLYALKTMHLPRVPAGGVDSRSPGLPQADPPTA